LIKIFLIKSLHFIFENFLLNFCIVDINKPWIVKKENLISKSKNTSIEDKKLQGKVTNTFVKGIELFKI